MVYQIDAGAKRLLWVGLDRTEDSLRGFFRMLSDEAKASIRYLCSDMWKPYLNVLAQEVSGAIHVLDRFHIMQAMNKAIDEVRAEEARRLKRDGYEPVLKHARWCLLKRPENLTRKQTVKLAELLKYNLQIGPELPAAGGLPAVLGLPVPGLGRTIPARVVHPDDAVADRADEEGGADAARPRGADPELVRARGTISAGVAEGLNNKAKLTTRKAYGFRTYDAVEIALYHNLGDLPEPEFTHKFC